MTKQVVVVARLRSAKGKGDALAAFLVEQAAAVKRAEPGCLVYRAHRSANDPELFLFYEVYADRAAFDVHRKAPHLAKYRKRREEAGLVEGAVEVDVFDALSD